MAFCITGHMCSVLLLLCELRKPLHGNGELELMPRLPLELLRVAPKRRYNAGSLNAVEKLLGTMVVIACALEDEAQTLGLPRAMLLFRMESPNFWIGLERCPLSYPWKLVFDGREARLACELIYGT